MNDLISRISPVDPVARVRALGPAILAAADTVERTRRISEPLLTGIHDARLFRMLLSASVGGDEIDPVTYVKAVELAGSPLMRRFRDIHTMSQQPRSRDVHYETCGQILLGNPPAVFL